ncbi:hypothetical protein VaNZ11_007007 [Volvox africanus]|uniref:RRM domain-containing protein n=1 Tax=Volvox africanus TaxID=51714 RepID=A0ABQ5S2A4_9CHLO|nr:hypothetical protein VaNZ11_007007 [Volvox africanus]
MDKVQSPDSRFNFVFAGSTSTTEAADNLDAALCPGMVAMVDAFTPHSAYSPGLCFHLGSRDQGTGSTRCTGRGHGGVGRNYRTTELHRRFLPGNCLQWNSMVIQPGPILATSPSLGHIDSISALTAEDSSGNALDKLISLLLLPDGDNPQVDGSNASAEPLLSSVSFTGVAMNNSPEADRARTTSILGSNAVANGPVESCNSLGRDRMFAGTHPDGKLQLPWLRASVGAAWGRQVCGQPVSSADGKGAGGHSPGVSSGKEDGAMLGLHALAAALDEVEASLDLPGATEAAAEEEKDHGWLPTGLFSQRQAYITSAAFEGQHQQTLRRLRRPKRVARRAVVPSVVSSGQESPLARSQQDQNVSLAGANADDSWRIMVSAPMPHNPEALATLLISGRLINPHTAMPAPLLAAAARAQQQQRQNQPKNRSCGGEDATYQSPSAPQKQQDGYLAAGGKGPAVALVRCASEHDMAAALALNGRRLYSPSMTRNKADSWRPLTVLVQAWAPAASEGGQTGMPPAMAVPVSISSCSPQGSRIRDTGPRLRRVVLTGLPGHMDVDDVIALFGNGLLLPGHCPTPQDRHFLLLCPDAGALSALMEWSGTRLPDKPLDALKQIIPRVNSWSTIRVEEDDGIQLTALMSQLMVSARVCNSTADNIAATAAIRRHQHYPSVAGRFHPAELDEMDEMATAALEAEGRLSGSGSGNLTARQSVKELTSEAVSSREGLCGGAVVGVSPSSLDKPRPHVAGAAAPAGPRAGHEPMKAMPSLDRSLEVPTGMLSLDSVHDAAAAAERAESSRGASSSGLATRPAPRFRRATHSASSQFSTSSSAAGAYFGQGISAGHGFTGATAAAAVAARCACCPPPSFAGRSGVGGGDAGPTSWSGQAAVELLNKLLALGIEPAAGSSPQGAGHDGSGVTRETEDRMPFFRRNRKRMPVYPLPDDEDEAEEEGSGEMIEQEADAGPGGDCRLSQAEPAKVEPAETAAADTGSGEEVWHTSTTDPVAGEVHGLQAEDVTPNELS